MAPFKGPSSQSGKKNIDKEEPKQKFEKRILISKTGRMKMRFCGGFNQGAADDKEDNERNENNGEIDSSQKMIGFNNKFH